MAQEDTEVQAWLSAYGQLPEERKRAMAMWFAAQKLTYESLGVSANDWWDLIEWAMHHPLDYSFVNDFPDDGSAAAGKAQADGSERKDSTRGAKKLVGAQTSTQAVADGPGIAEKAKSEKELDKELFQRFMKERGRKGKKG